MEKIERVEREERDFYINGKYLRGGYFLKDTYVERSG
jgi:hypothetical protein